MKLTKSLFLAFAGLGLFACSNEEITDNGGVQGNATVTVTINDVISRMVTDPTTGTDNTKFPVEITSATLTLDAGSGQVTKDLVKDKLITDGGGSLKNATVIFDKIRNPQKLTLVINGGVEKTSESGLELKNVVETGLAEPLWASTTQFTATSETEYTATLTPDHRLARLQFSGIKHVDADADCIYTSLDIDGVFLDGALKTEWQTAKYTIDNTAPEAVWSTVSSSWDAKIYDAVEANNGFLTGTIFPEKVVVEEDTEKEQCYAYNVFPAKKEEGMPKLVVCFSNATVKPGVILPEGTKPYRFAKVNYYKLTDGGEITEFKAGYIYNITGLTIDDEDLGLTPEGGKDITLTATVTVTPWTLINGTVDWQ